MVPERNFAVILTRSGFRYPIDRRTQAPTEQARKLTWPTKQANKGRYAIFGARPAGLPTPRLPQRVPDVANPCRASQRQRPRRRALRRRQGDRSTAPSVGSRSRPRAGSAAIAGHRWQPQLPSRPNPRSRAWRRLSPCPCCLREEFPRRSPSLRRLLPRRPHRRQD